MQLEQETGSMERTPHLDSLFSPVIRSHCMSGRMLKVPDLEKMAVEAGFQPDRMAAFHSLSLRQLQRRFARRFGKTPGGWPANLDAASPESWSHKATPTKRSPQN